MASLALLAHRVLSLVYPRKEPLLVLSLLVLLPPVLLLLLALLALLPLVLLRLLPPLRLLLVLQPQLLPPL